MRGTWQTSPPSIAQGERCSLSGTSLDALVCALKTRCRFNARALLCGIVLLLEVERRADQCHVQECRHTFLANVLVYPCAYFALGPSAVLNSVSRKLRHHCDLAVLACAVVTDQKPLSGSPSRTAKDGTRIEPRPALSVDRPVGSGGGSPISGRGPLFALPMRSTKAAQSAATKPDLLRSPLLGLKEK